MSVEEVGELKRYSCVPLEADVVFGLSAAMELTITDDGETSGEAEISAAAPLLECSSSRHSLSILPSDIENAISSLTTNSFSATIAALCSTLIGLRFTCEETEANNRFVYSLSTGLTAKLLSY